MKKSKGQVDIISVLFIVGISLFFVTATYTWAIPQINGITSLNEIKRMENQMLELHNAILQVSREKTQRVISLNIKEGTLRIRDNSILYKGSFDMPENNQGFESIIFGGICTPNPINCSRINCSEGIIGNLGEDEPVCLLKRGNTELELRYFYLNDTYTGKIYGLNFIYPNNAFAGIGSHQIAIRWINETITGSPQNITKNIQLDIY